MKRAHAGRERIVTARRIVVKVGTSVIVRHDGRPAVGRLHELVDSIVTLRNGGRELLLVSSGAVRLGAGSLRPEMLEGGEVSSLRTPARKRSCAAIGQGKLMRLYMEAFGWSGVPPAQLLVTDEQFADPASTHALRTTLEALLDSGAVPILNENDAVHDGGEHGDGTASSNTPRIIRDNDTLAALVAETVGADLLVLLSDVDGVYTGNPTRGAAALIPIVDTVTPELLAAADGGHPWGRGGMAGKVAGAYRAAEAGTTVVIANGHTPDILARLCAGEPLGTLFPPTTPVHQDVYTGASLT